MTTHPKDTPATSDDDQTTVGRIQKGISWSHVE